MHDRRLSRLLSLVLRHDPGRLGIELDRGGWVEVPTLLAALAGAGHPVSRADLRRVVTENDKQRFTLDEHGDRIRAAQGHSVPVELGLPPQEPPEVLYHGTAPGNLAPILRDGLHRAGRHAVHLSPDIATASRVGARRGAFVVLAVDAAAMHRAGHRFTRSENGVWLVDAVPPAHLRVLP